VSPLSSPVMEELPLDDPRVKRVVDAGTALGIKVEPVRFPEGTRTAVDAARALGCDLAQIVKTLIFVDENDRPLVFYVSGVDRLDLSKGAAAAGVKELRKADARTTKEATGFSIGGVPPFGHATEIREVMDERLLSLEELWAAGGLPDAVFLIAPDDLLRVTDAVVAEVRE
jgi:Cys-tRNA(Pro) deacylase